jgi:hypothetical protein
MSFLERDSKEGLMANRKIIETHAEDTQAMNAAVSAAAAESTTTVEVLYQKMGDRWFAFSLIDNEVFVGSISQDEIDEANPANSRAGSA